MKNIDLLTCCLNANKSGSATLEIRFNSIRLFFV